MSPLCYPERNVTTLTAVNLDTISSMIKALKEHRVINGIINNNISTSGNWAKDSSNTSKQLYGRFIASNISSRESLVEDYIVKDNPIYYQFAKLITKGGADMIKELTVKSLLLFLALKENQVKCQICCYALSPMVKDNSFDNLHEHGYICSLCHHKNMIKTEINAFVNGLFITGQTTANVALDDFFNVSDSAANSETN